MDLPSQLGRAMNRVHYSTAGERACNRDIIENLAEFMKSD